MCQANRETTITVTSPVAQRLLSHISRRYRVNTNADTLHKIRQVELEQELPGISNLWGRLVASDLAQRLASPDQLLDVTSAMPPAAARFQRMFTPRTLEQKVDLLITHLDWYVSPQLYEPSLHFFRMVRGYTVVAGVLAILLLAALLFASYYGLLFHEIAALVIGAALIVWRLWRFTHNFVPEQVYDRRNTERKRNATVLYHYLCRELRDVE